MIFLLDTDVLIFMIRGLKSARRPAQRQRAQALVERCRQTQADGDVLALSAVTVSELEYGARHSGAYEAEMAAVHKALVPFEVFDYDALKCPPHYGRIREQLERRGVAIGSMDLLIAAQALALAATLVSNNQAHFGRIEGLATTNWLSG